MYTHPVIVQQLAQAKIAELHRHAQRDALARAASRARSHQTRHRLPLPRIAITRRVLAAPGTRNP